ncbi:MAG: hypothetical protein K2W95_20910 [Candidatus Obscuribacterales bacterium]|nr:hypothetical protein [Candidatus Obscuribacterales bacterium]
MRVLLLLLLCCPSAQALDVYPYAPTRDKPVAVPPKYIVVVNDQTGEERYYLPSKNPLRLPRRVR